MIHNCCHCEQLYFKSLIWALFIHLSYCSPANLVPIQYKMVERKKLLEQTKTDSNVQLTYVHVQYEFFCCWKREKTNFSNEFLFDHQTKRSIRSFVRSFHTHILQIDARFYIYWKKISFQMIHPTTTWFSSLFSVWFSPRFSLSFTYNLNAYFCVCVQCAL